MNRYLEYGLSRVVAAAVYAGLGGAALGLGGCGSKEATATAGVRATCPAGAQLAVLGIRQPDSYGTAVVDLSCLYPLDLNFSKQRLPSSNFPLDYKALEPGDGEQPQIGDLAIQFSYDKQTSDNDSFPGQPHVEFLLGNSDVLRVQIDDVTAIQSAEIELK